MKIFLNKKVPKRFKLIYKEQYKERDILFLVRCSYIFQFRIITASDIRLRILIIDTLVNLSEGQLFIHSNGIVDASIIKLHEGKLKNLKTMCF